MKIITKPKGTIYTKGYTELQKRWLSVDQELLLVGQLAYWTYLLSKIAENHQGSERKRLFSLKEKCISLLTQSKYTEVRKHIPLTNKRICDKHARKGKYLYSFLNNRDQQKEIQACDKCQNGIEHYYTVFSVAIQDRCGEDKKIPQFIFRVPYLKFKHIFPRLEELEDTKYISKKELGRLIPDEPLINLYQSIHPKNIVLKNVKQSYSDLMNFYGQ